MRVLFQNLMFYKINCAKMGIQHAAQCSDRSILSQLPLVENCFVFSRNILVISH